MNMFSIENAVFEIILKSMSEHYKFLLVFLSSSWLLGVNVGNNKFISNAKYFEID